MNGFSRAHRTFWALLAVLAASHAARADDDRRAPGVPLLPAYKQECAACHVAFPPGMLPSDSWRRLLNNLPHHFGTDASLDAATARELSTWLRANAGTYRGMYVQGEDIAQSDPNVKHVKAALASLDLLIVQDLFLNETSAFAHVFLPGTSFLEKDGTFTNAERRINRVRPVMAAKTGKQEWQITCELATAMGYPMDYDNGSQIMDEIAATTPTFARVSFARLDEAGSLQWPCTDAAPDGTPIMHVDGFVRGKGHFVDTPFVPTDERTSRKFPLILTTGRIQSQYNVGAQTRRTENVQWHGEDILEIHPHDAEERGIVDGSPVSIVSRVGETVLRARIADRMPQGVVYTTFHYPSSGANVVTTEFSDWATNCPEYKVTAVQVAPTSKLPVGA